MCAFYDPNPEPDLRFGDVITGFHLCVPQLHHPGAGPDGCVLTVAMTRPSYFAVMSPCCSIKNKQLSLTPLVQIRPAIKKTPYFVEDLTRINRRGPPDKIVPPQEWAKFTPEEQATRLAEGDDYALVDAFVYAPDPRLKTYELRLQATNFETTGHYLIEFGSVHRIDCDPIKRNSPAPEGVKLLQLSVLTREELRQKIGSYFVRIPEEDRPFLP